MSQSDGERLQTTTHRVEVGLVVAGCVLSVAWSVFLYATGRVHVDGDECVLAIQGMRMVREGEWSVFYPAQDYMGCLEAYALAALYWMTRATGGWAVRAFGVLESLGFLLSGWWLVRRCFGRRAALYALLWMALGSNYLAGWSVKIRGYLPLLILANLALIQYCALNRPSEGERRVWRYGLLGLTLGVAWWANPLAACVVASLGVAFVVGRSTRADLVSGLRSGKWVALLNGAMLLVAAVLVSRALMAPRRVWLLRTFYEWRILILGFLGLLTLAVGVTLARMRRHRARLAPSVLALSLLVGMSPALAYYWSRPVLNLKPSGAMFAMWWTRQWVTVFTTWPDVLGVSNGPFDGHPLLLPGWVLIGVLGLYALMLYAILRRPRAPWVWLFLLHAAMTYGVVNLLGTGSWAHTRYLLPLCISLAALWGVFAALLDGLVRGMGAAATGLILAVHLWGGWALEPHRVELASGLIDDEPEMLRLARRYEPECVFLRYNDDGTMRLNLVNGEKIVFLSVRGYFNRFEHYDRLAGRLSHFDLIVRRDGEFADAWDGPPAARFDGWHYYRRVPAERIRGVLGPMILRREAPLVGDTGL